MDGVNLVSQYVPLSWRVVPTEQAWAVLYLKAHVAEQIRGKIFPGFPDPSQALLGTEERAERDSGRTDPAREVQQVLQDPAGQAHVLRTEQTPLIISSCPFM